MSTYKEKGDEFLQNSLETVNKQIIKLTTIITELLDLSKIKAGSLQLMQEEFCITDLIKEIVKEIQHTSPDCVIKFAEKENAKVYADRGRIGQVMINLLTNAIKYSPNCKEITISCKVLNNEVSIAVTDSGIGINRTDQEKIFQRFYRVAGKDERTFPGFGIGLFIASEIIRRHNGNIGVESEPGKGSVFYFSLPLKN
jgi:signal transduction histidine kinase